MPEPAPPTSPDDALTASFEAVPTSGAGVRRFVSGILEDWALESLVDDAVLCAGELATNAVLHTRATFTVSVRRAGPGVRIDVLDTAPEQLPDPVQLAAAVAQVTATGTTGRGLRIIDALASRWGYATTTDTKTVWVELGSGAPAGPRPEVAIGHRAPPPDATVTLRFLGLPVAVSVASGMQVDDTVRGLQLGFVDLAEAEGERLFDLLERSAVPRLTGRHAALRAAGEGRLDYDLDLAVTADALAATVAIGEQLAALSSLPGLATAAVSPEVHALRSWLTSEGVAQLGGASPSPCPLGWGPATGP